MKKEAKATAVKKGTFYECMWCGKEGTNSQYTTTSQTPVCGRMVDGKTYSYCSRACGMAYTKESGRKLILRLNDWATEVIDMCKLDVTEAINAGVKVRPVVLRIAKVINVYKKVLVAIISGDNSTAQKLYDKHKETITDCAEDILADEDEAYMAVLNKFAGLKTVLASSFRF